MFEHINHAVVKVTRDCNLRCKYCYVADKDKYKNEVMSFDVFKDLVNRIIKDRIKNNTYREEFNFTFHGGEPTIIGYDTLNKYLSYAYNEFKINNLNVNFSIQTNTTLLDEKFLDLFKDYNVAVGISYDGIGDNNKDRTTKESRHYENIIEESKKRHIHLGNICIVNKDNINTINKNIKYFNKIKLNGKYNYAEDALNIGNCEISGEEYFNKCIKPMIDYAIKKKSLKYIPDGNLLRIIKSYCNKLLLNNNKNNLRQSPNNKSICYTKFCGGGCRVLEISPDGSINSCGRYDKDSENSIVGTIYSNDFLGLQKRAKFYDLIYKKHNAILSHNCDLCESQDICDFGCMVFSFIKSKKWDIDSNLVCSYFKLLKKYLYDNINSLMICYINSLFKDKNTIYIDVKNNSVLDTIRNINIVLNDFSIKNVKAFEDDNWQGDKKDCHQIKLVKKGRFNIWH